MGNKTGRRTMSRKEYILTMKNKDVAKLLHGFCENSERCYYCPLFTVDCAGVDASEEDWEAWLDKPAEREA